MRWSRAMRKQVLACVEQLDERAPDYRDVLADLAAVLQKLALLQAVPDLQLDEAEDVETYKRLAGCADAGGHAALLSDRDRRSARPGAGARYSRRLRDGPAAHAGVRRGRRCAAQLSSPAAARQGGRPRRSPPRRRRRAAHGAGRRDERLVGDGRADESAGHGEGSSQRTARWSAGRATGSSSCSTRTASISAARSSKRSLTQALSAYFGEPVRLELSVADRALDTLGAPAEGGGRRSRAEGARSDRQRSERARDARHVRRHRAAGLRPPDRLIRSWSVHERQHRQHDETGAAAAGEHAARAGGDRQRSK